MKAMHSRRSSRASAGKPPRVRRNSVRAARARDRCGLLLGKTDAEIFPPKPAASRRANDLQVLESGVPMVFDEFAIHDDGPPSIVIKFPLLDCCFECPQPVSMPDNVMATHLYRIAQEAVNNAIKHGRASQIRIELVDALGIITLTVQNNGLVVSKTRSFKDGIGLRIMRYRAKMIDGSLIFHSDAKRGTTVVCTI